MLVLEISFLAGRYHATSWGRNVNEGVPEWPPSPYRLVRALLDAWKRKRPQWPESRVGPILAALASEPPLMHLPPANSGHFRYFLSQNLQDSARKQRIFDAFVVFGRDNSVLMGWPDVSLEPGALSELEELSGLVQYLGRSESWTAIRVAQTDGIEWNCRPVSDEAPPDAQNREEMVQVACPIPMAIYDSGTGGLSGETLSWLEAIAMSTSELHRSGQSEPPAIRNVVYRRPYPCFRVIPEAHGPRKVPVLNGVLYLLHSNVLPHVTSTLELAERVRRKLMGMNRMVVGDSTRISRSFSGKDTEGRPASEHWHAYYLPLDSDGDGWLDHMLVIGKEPLVMAERLALDRLESVWQSNGRPDLKLVPVRWGTTGDLLTLSRKFCSATPFVPSRHYRKGRGEFGEWLISEVRREAGNHGLPEPVKVTILPALTGGKRTIRWLDFRRSRKGEGEKIGYGFELEFGEPVPGPFSIGYGAHFGMGMFAPAKKGPNSRP